MEEDFPSDISDVQADIEKKSEEHLKPAVLKTRRVRQQTATTQDPVSVCDDVRAPHPQEASECHRLGSVHPVVVPSDQKRS